MTVESEEKKIKRKRNWPLLILLTIVAGIIGKYIGGYYGDKRGAELARVANSTQIPDSQLNYYRYAFPTVAVELNMTLPKKIDSTMMLDSVSTNSLDSSFTYYYQMLNTSKKDLNIDRVKKNFIAYLNSRRQQLENENKDFFVNQVKVFYVYFDKDKEFICKIKRPC